MNDRELVINGREEEGSLEGPAAALSRFYRAFNTRDLALMELVWDHGAGVAMSNPVGGIARGWEEIRRIYARIFGGAAQVWVEFHDIELLETGESFCAVGRERGTFRIGEEEIALAIRTSRIFFKSQGEWRQVHHHGSIDDPALLRRYQSAVTGAALPEGGR